MTLTDVFIKTLPDVFIKTLPDVFIKTLPGVFIKTLSCFRVVCTQLPPTLTRQLTYLQVQVSSLKTVPGAVA